MPVIKHQEALERVFRKPVFSPKDLQNEGMAKNYSKKLLCLLARSGRIHRVERGKYTRLDDPVAVAAYITVPCYLSLWTAMSIRNLTTQIPFAVEVITSRRRFRNRINFAGTPIIFHTVNPRMLFGYEIIMRENTRIPVARPEKIVIDAVHISNIPEEEVLQVIKRSNLPVLRRYAKLTGNKTVMDKIEEMIKCSQSKR